MNNESKQTADDNYNEVRRRAYIGIGSNIDANSNIAFCSEIMRIMWPEIRFSSVWKTAALEYENQNDFLNAVAVIQTDKDPQTLLLQMKSIEEKLSKNPEFKFGPRTIDLDLLLFDDEVIKTEELTVPHPKMHERRFVLEPLNELIDVESKHSLLNETWKDLLEKVKDQKCEKLKTQQVSSE